MGIFISDPLTDVDGTLLQNHGTNWFKHPTRIPDFVFASNAIFSNAGAGIRTLYYNDLIPSTPDYLVSGQIKFLTDNNVSEIGICARLDTVAETMYYATVELAANTLRIGKMLAGVNTTLNTIAWTPANGTLSLDVDGNNITALWDGVPQVTIVDNDIAVAGLTGIRAFNGATNVTGVHIDLFLAQEDDLIEKKHTFPVGRIGRLGI